MASRAVVVLALLLCVAPVALFLGQAASDDLREVVAGGAAPALIGRTLQVAGVGALLALVLGLGLAFLVERTDAPFPALFTVAALAPAFVPPLVIAIAWGSLLGSGGPWTCAWVFGVAGSPFPFFLASSALRASDGRREEAALLTGGRPLAVRMALHGALPAALAGSLLVFVLAAGDFAVPDYLASIGERFPVLASEVFFRWQRLESDGHAAAASLPIVALGVAAIVPLVAVRRRGGIAQLRSESAHPFRHALGKSRWPAALGAAAVLTLVVGLPMGQLGGTAAGNPDIAVLDSLREAKGNLAFTLGVGAGTALAAGLLACGLAAVAARSREGAVVDALVLLPLTVPAVALGIATIRMLHPSAAPGWMPEGMAEGYLAFLDAVYLSPLAAMVALLPRVLPFAFAGAVAAFARLPAETIEAARVSGLGPVSCAWRITRPLVAGGVVGGALLAFAFSVREVDALALLPAGNPAAIFRIYNAVHFNRPEFVAALSLAVAALAAWPLAVHVLWRRAPLEVK